MDPMDANADNKMLKITMTRNEISPQNAYDMVLYGAQHRDKQTNQFTFELVNGLYLEVPIDPKNATPQELFLASKQFESGSLPKQAWQEDAEEKQRKYQKRFHQFFGNGIIGMGFLTIGSQMFPKETQNDGQAAQKTSPQSTLLVSSNKHKNKDTDHTAGGYAACVCGAVMVAFMEIGRAHV